METILLGTVLLGSILLIARNLKRKFKGESCSSCQTGASKCSRMVKGDES